MAVYPISPTDRRIDATALETVTKAIFTACGMEGADGALLARSLVRSDLRGVHSHGVLRVPDYVGKLTREGVDPKGRPRVLSEVGGAIRIDGGNSMGQIGGTFAIERAIAVAAGGAGIAFAGLGNSNHCGAMDWYTMRAAEAGLIGLAGTNDVAHDGAGGRAGQDRRDQSALRGDARRGKAFRDGLRLRCDRAWQDPGLRPEGVADPGGGWALDADGRPTTDAAAALAGLIQPIGGHKGVALGMAIGMLSSFLGGSGYGLETGNMVDGPVPGKDGQFFVAIDVSAFVDLQTFRSRVDAAMTQVHRSSRAEGASRLLVPGQIEAECELDYGRDGIPLPATTLDDIVEVGTELGLEDATMTVLGLGRA